MQVRNAIERRFPGTEVVGTNFPPPKHKQAMAQLAQAGTVSAISVSVFGDQIFGALGMPVPELVAAMQQNKVGACMMAWMGGNTLAANLLNTGAFEVYYDGKMIHSKLETGRLPTLPALMEDLDRAMRARQQARAQELELDGTVF